MKFVETIDSHQQGIWKYAPIWQRLLDAGSIPSEKFSLREGETALETVSENLYLKREDQNPTGSHKSRLLAWQVSQAVASGIPGVVISSTGNAGISAAFYSKIAGLSLMIFVSPGVSTARRQVLAQLVDQVVPLATGSKAELEKASKDHLGKNRLLFITPNAIRLANLAATSHGYVNLRASRDDGAYIPYQSIAWELWQEQSDIKNIITWSGSGKSAQGIYEGYKFLHSNGEVEHLPKLWLLQEATITKSAQEKKVYNEIISQMGGEIIKVESKYLELGKKLNKKLNEAMSREPLAALGYYQQSLARFQSEPTAVIISGTDWSSSYAQGLVANFNKL